MKALASVPSHLVPVLTAHPLFSGLPTLARAAFIRDCAACELSAGEALAAGEAPAGDSLSSSPPQAATIAVEAAAARMNQENLLRIS